MACVTSRVWPRATLVPLALAGLLAVLGSLPAAAAAAPPVVEAYYMYGTTASALEQNAYNHGCSFAQSHPGSDRVLLLDFGAARMTGPDNYGAVDFSNTLFGNPTILDALKSASNGAHNCHTTGTTEIVYGNSNYHMTSSGMTDANAEYMGYWQAERANDLSNYELNNGRTSQDANAGTDMEPAWDARPISNWLVKGASEANVVYDYDYGSADGCPSSGSGGSCSNGWGVNDVAYASFYGVALSLPEIYYSVNASQWTVVRKNWDANHTTSYWFAGVTGTTGVGLSATSGWNALSSDNPGVVHSTPGIVCFC